MENLKRQSTNKQHKFTPRFFLMLTFFGIMNLLTMLNRPIWTAIRGVDVIRLIGTGMCFGGALIAFATYLQDRKSSRTGSIET